jgi:hypothetical protein
MAFWQAKNPLLVTGQAVDRTPTGRTAKDDGGNAIAGLGDDRLYESLTTGQYSGTTTITVNAIDDVHTNNVVVDKRTGLMWQAAESEPIYGAGADELHWDDQVDGEDIFNFCDQANIAGLSGYSDWRVPNVFEIFGIMSLDTSTGHPDSAYWPTVSGTTFLWSSTTQPSDITRAIYMNLSTGVPSGQVKTTTKCAVILVRGGL